MKYVVLAMIIAALAFVLPETYAGRKHSPHLMSAPSAGRVWYGRWSGAGLIRGGTRSQGQLWERSNCNFELLIGDPAELGLVADPDAVVLPALSLNRRVVCDGRRFNSRHRFELKGRNTDELWSSRVGINDPQVREGYINAVALSAGYGSGKEISASIHLRRNRLPSKGMIEEMFQSADGTYIRYEAIIDKVGNASAQDWMNHQFDSLEDFFTKLGWLDPRR